MAAVPHGGSYQVVQLPDGSFQITYDGIVESGDTFELKTNFEYGSPTFIVQGSKLEIKSGNLTLTQANTLVVQGAKLELESGNLTLTQANVLVVQGAKLELESDNLALSGSGITLATVTHTAHGFRTNMKVLVEGAVPNVYNGIKTITVTGTNTYTYAISGTADGSVSGTITVTAVIIDDTSDSIGVAETSDHRYTSSQPVTGKARLASAGEYYKPGSFVGTITSAGLAGSILLIGDE